MQKEYILDMKKPFNTVINMKRLVFYKRLLTEMSQKITLNNSNHIKNKKCPCTLHDGNHSFKSLHRCHVGVTRSMIIDGVLDDFPEELDAHKLCQEVMLRHLDVQVVFACPRCNKLLENIDFVKII
jgi:hypothetical protein